jgi:hypothetical protein
MFQRYIESKVAHGDHWNPPAVIPKRRQATLLSLFCYGGNTTEQFLAPQAANRLSPPSSFPISGGFKREKV